jgi:hypothetical protein
VYVTDPDDLDELIADCAAIPTPPRPAEQVFPRTAAPWTVDDACYAQVSELEEYV